MSDFWLKMAFLLGIVARIVIRSPYNRRRQQNRVATARMTTQEMVSVSSSSCWRFGFSSVSMWTWGATGRHFRPGGIRLRT